MITTTTKTTSPIILTAIVMLGVIAGYFYYNQVLQEEALPVVPVNISVDDSLNKLKELKLDFSGLDAPAFKSLGIFGESPVSPGSTGRTDIFAPF